MTVPKTTETRCSDGNVQEHMLYKGYTSPSLHLAFFFSKLALPSNLIT